MKTVKENFKTIHGWLEENATKILNESLNSGAGNELIEKLQSEYKKELPEDFKELYTLHNGLNDESNLGSLFYGMQFYSIENIIRDRESRKTTYPLKKASIQINPQNINHPDWLCIAFDGSHVRICMDLSPNTTGVYGQIILVDEEYEVAFVIAQSITELVEKFTYDLLNDKYSLDEDALEDGNEYLSPDTSIDLVNWYTKDEWKEFIKKNEPLEVATTNEIPDINIDDYQWIKKPFLDIGTPIITDNEGYMTIYDQTSNKYGLINSEGQVIIPVISIIPVKINAPYITKEEDTFNLVDVNGSTIFSLKAHSVNELYPLYLFQTYEGSILFDKHGKEVKKIFTNERAYSDGLLGISIILQGNNSASGFIDEEGKTVIDFKYRSISSFSEGLAAVQREDYVWEYIDTKGKTVFVLPEQWIGASPFLNGYAMIHYKDDKNNGFIFVNKNFQVVSKDYYSSYSGMHNGLFIVSKDGHNGGIDTNGNIIIPFEYTNIQGGPDGTFVVTKRNFKNHFDNKDKLWARENTYQTYGALDQSGATILECKFTSLSSAGSDLFIVRKEKHVGYINSKEEVILPIVFDALRPVKNGEAWVKYKGKWGILKIG